MVGVEDPDLDVEDQVVVVVPEVDLETVAEDLVIANQDLKDLIETKVDLVEGKEDSEISQLAPENEVQNLDSQDLKVRETLQIVALEQNLRDIQEVDAQIVAVNLGNLKDHLLRIWWKISFQIQNLKDEATGEENSIQLRIKD